MGTWPLKTPAIPLLLTSFMTQSSGPLYSLCVAGCVCRRIRMCSTGPATTVLARPPMAPEAYSSPAVSEHVRGGDVDGSRGGAEEDRRQVALAPYYS